MGAWRGGWKGQGGGACVAVLGCLGVWGGMVLGGCGLGRRGRLTLGGVEEEASVGLVKGSDGDGRESAFGDSASDWWRGDRR